jgi:hypothetical protein
VNLKQYLRREIAILFELRNVLLGSKTLKGWTSIIHKIQGVRTDMRVLICLMMGSKQKQNLSPNNKEVDVESLAPKSRNTYPLRNPLATYQQLIKHRSQNSYIPFSYSSQSMSPNSSTTSTLAVTQSKLFQQNSEIFKIRPVPVTPLNESETSLSGTPSAAPPVSVTPAPKPVKFFLPRTKAQVKNTNL